MLSLKKKYRDYLQGKEQYFRKDAKEYFSYEQKSPPHDSTFIFELYKDAETWTSFYEDKVRYQFLGKRGEIEYDDLDKIMHEQLLRTRKIGLDDRIESNDHVIWVANIYVWTQTSGFANKMSAVIAAIKKYGEGFSWYKEEDE